MKKLSKEKQQQLVLAVLVTCLALGGLWCGLINTQKENVRKLSARAESASSRLEQFKRVINFQGGDLEKEYNKFNGTLQESESKAAEVRNRIRDIEDVSQALFSEWRTEIKQYNSDTLRKSSQRKYDIANKKYSELIKSMKKAEAKLEPGCCVTLSPGRHNPLRNE